MKIPKSQLNNGTALWTQPNNTDNAGDLWASFCLDFSENEGRLRLGKKTILNTGTSDVAELTAVPIAFINNSASVFTFAGVSNVGYPFKNNATIVGTFAKETTSGFPTTIDSTKSDAVFSNLAVYVSSKASASTNVSLYKKSYSGSWSEITTTEDNATDIYTNMLCTFKGRTYMSSQFSKIISLNSADTIAYSGSYTLTLDVAINPATVITKLIPADDRMFITTLNLYGGDGYVYEWDGNTTDYQYRHRLETSGVLAGTVFEGTPYLVDVEGKLLRWNGGTFEEVAKFNRENNLPLVYSTNYSSVNNRFIHPNGMTIVDGKILLLINNLNADSTGSIEETIPSGVWEFDPKVPSKGLIHKHAVSFNKSTDILSQFGGNRLASVGAIKNMRIPSNASGANGTFLLGAGYYDSTATAKYGIFYEDRNDTLIKAGYFVTSKIDSLGSKGTMAVKNMWQKVVVLYRKLLTADDRIIIKYRTTDVASVEATITWTSTTTFTTTTDVSSYWTVGIGGEVEITQGIGGGRCSHITNIAYSGGTYTVTVDTAHYRATGTAKARFQSWKYLKTISSQADTYQEASPQVKANWIQFKVWVSWRGRNEIEKLLTVDDNSTPAI